MCAISGAARHVQAGYGAQSGVANEAGYIMVTGTERLLCAPQCTAF